MRSFDFYDTLVTRLVADPADIFSIVEERLKIPGFRPMRVQAEINARSMESGEVTFEQIYQQIPLPSNVKKEAQELEYELERSLVAPVAAILSQLRTGDLIVSDMYHDEKLYREVLGRLSPDVAPGAVLISGATKKTKASGELWKQIATMYPSHQSHIGDNFRGDFRQPRKNGLDAVHYLGATLNRYESGMAACGLDGSIIAGISRATRLSLIRSGCPEADAATITAFASVIGPLLHAFSHWVLNECEEEGVRDIYFLARDGQLPFRICSSLVAESGQDLRCHYICASRQALHLPGCESIEAAESWLLEDTPHLSLRVIAERGGIALEAIRTAAEGHLAIDPEDNIPKARRSALRSIIREPSFIAAFEESTKRAFGPAAAYYLAQRLGETESVALVDVGWNGRLQRSLGTLLGKMECRPTRMLGLYLCLSRRLSSAPGDDLRGFVADPEHPSRVRIFDRYRHVFEAALSADHPTTTGFEFEGGESRPLFGQPYTPATQKKIELQHATLSAFMENVIAVGRATGRAVRPVTSAAIGNFEMFLRYPTLNDGRAFAGFSFIDGQAGTESEVITRNIAALDLLRPNADFGYWPEGSLSASGFKFLLRPRSCIKRLLDGTRFVLTRGGVTHRVRRLVGK